MSAEFWLRPGHQLWQKSLSSELRCLCSGARGSSLRQCVSRRSRERHRCNQQNARGKNECLQLITKGASQHGRVSTKLLLASFGALSLHCSCCRCGDRACTNAVTPSSGYATMTGGVARVWNPDIWRASYHHNIMIRRARLPARTAGSCSGSQCPVQVAGFLPIVTCSSVNYGARCREPYDVVVTFEERVMDQVIEGEATSGGNKLYRPAA